MIDLELLRSAHCFPDDILADEVPPQDDDRISVAVVVVVIASLDSRGRGIVRAVWLSKYVKQSTAYSIFSRRSELGCCPAVPLLCSRLRSTAPFHFSRKGSR